MRIVVPGGTVIPIVVADNISSATANVGDTFAIQASADVVVNGWVVIAKGAPGQGEILSVDRAGSHGHPGSLGVQYDWIFAVDGDKVKLTNQRSTQEGQGEAGVASTMTILSYALLGPLGLFTHNFVKGHDVEVDSSIPLKAYVGESVYVVATTREDTGGGFAPAIAAGYAPSPETPAPQSVTTAPAQQTGEPATPPIVGGSTNASPSQNTTSPSTTPTGMAPPAPTVFAEAVATSSPQQTNGSSVTQPTTAASTVAEAATAPSSSEQGTSLLDLQGTGPKTSQTFTATGFWAVQYSFDCSASPKGTPTGFSLLVNGASTPIRPIIQAGVNGTDVTPTIQQVGTFTLHVESHCLWHVRALTQ